MSSEAVKVIVRCRPMNEREDKLKCEVVLNMDTEIGQVQLRKPQVKDGTPKLFTFDGVFYTQDTTEQIYEDICFPLVEGVLNGYNGTVFAYGQTGCGKSYTMMGVDEPAANRGVIPRAFDHIFDHIAVSAEVKYLLTASYLEIYNEEVRDLLGKDVKKKLELHEHPEKGVYVQGLSSHKVHNAHDLSRVMELGSKNRSVGATLMNVDSSRSHSIFTIDIEMVQEGGEGSGIRAGRLNLVDLAGSERQSKTGSTGDRLKEATKINLSLSALGNVISALVDGRSTHIPYRDSKLTRLLQSSLGGNTKTIMVACVSPADNNYDETLSTLRYANRAKNIKNKPRINEDPKDALLRQYREEIERLKQMLGGEVQVPGQPLAQASTEDHHHDWEAEREAIRLEYERKMAELRQQYDQVHTDKTQLQEQLTELQKQQQQELENLQNRLNQFSDQTQPNVHSGPPGVPTTTDQNKPQPTTGSNAQLTMVGSDSRQLVEHEAALQRLEEIQQTMIGGERAGDSILQQELSERRQKADNRQELLARAKRSLEDEDGILEGIFNSLTDEVRAKSRALERCQTKLQSAQEDITDLQTEFELERQDYLDTIRNQERILKLHEQLLSTVAGLVRRDCNYYNIDKIKTECTWDEDRLEWNLPRVTVTKTTLSSVPSHSSMQKRSASTSTLQSTTSSFGTKLRGTSPSTSPRSSHHYGPIEEIEEERRRTSGEELEYFRPKRALELLAEGAQMRGVDPRKWEGPPNTGTSNAAAVHGIGTMLAGDPSLSWKRGRLQSLPLPPSHQSPQSMTQDVLEAMERKKSKWRSLEPLGDTHNKRPPP